MFYETSHPVQDPYLLSFGVSVPKSENPIAPTTEFIESHFLRDDAVIGIIRP